MSIIWLSGFEAGTVAGITALGNAGQTFADAESGSAVTTSNPRSGTYALSLGGSTAARNVQLNTSTLGTTSALVASGYLMLPSLPSATVDVLLVTVAAGNSLSLHVNSSDGTLRAQWATGTEITGPALSANVWYAIEVYADVSTGTSRLKWRVNGVDQTDATVAQTATTVSAFVIGRTAVDSGSTVVRADDWVVSVTGGDYPLGPHRVVLVKPDTGGTATQIGTADAMARFTSNGSGLDATFNSSDILAATSEVPPLVGGTATGVYQRTSSTTSAVELPLTTATLGGGESISAVRAVIVGWAASTLANNVELRGYDGSVETTLFARADPNFSNSSVAPPWLCAMWSNTWTQTKLDNAALRFGYSNDISPQPGAHFLGLEVAIKQVAAAPSVIATAATIPTPTISSPLDALATPAVVAAAAAMLSASLNMGGTATPAIAAVVASIPAPSPQGGASAAPATAAMAASVPAPSISASGTILAAAVTCVASVPTPGISTGSVITLTTVAGVAAISAVTANAGSMPTPATTAVAAAVPAVSLSLGEVAVVDTITAVAAMPQVGIRASARKAMLYSSAASTAAFSTTATTAVASSARPTATLEVSQ